MIKTFCHFKKIFFLSLRPITILAYHRWETEAQRAVAGLRSCSLLKAALRSVPGFPSLGSYPDQSAHPLIHPSPAVQHEADLITTKQEAFISEITVVVQNRKTDAFISTLWEQEAGRGWPLVVGICSSGELSRRRGAGYRDTVVSPASGM